MENEIAIADAPASASSATSLGSATGQKKPNAFLVVFLLLTIVALVAIDMYQDRVIQRQRYELRWLMTHSIIRPDAPASGINSQKPAPKPEGTQSSAAAKP